MTDESTMPGRSVENLAAFGSTRMRGERATARQTSTSRSRVNDEPLYLTGDTAPGADFISPRPNPNGYDYGKIPFSGLRLDARELQREIADILNNLGPLVKDIAAFLSTPLSELKPDRADYLYTAIDNAIKSADKILSAAQSRYDKTRTHAQLLTQQLEKRADGGQAGFEALAQISKLRQSMLAFRSMMDATSVPDIIAGLNNLKGVLDTKIAASKALSPSKTKKETLVEVDAPDSVGEAESESIPAGERVLRRVLAIGGLTSMFLGLGAVANPDTGVDNSTNPRPPVPIDAQVGSENAQDVQQLQLQDLIELASLGNKLSTLSIPDFGGIYEPEITSANLTQNSENTVQQDENIIYQTEQFDIPLEVLEAWEDGDVHHVLAGVGEIDATGKEVIYRPVVNNGNFDLPALPTNSTFEADFIVKVSFVNYIRSLGGEGEVVIYARQNGEANGQASIAVRITSDFGYDFPDGSRIEYTAGSLLFDIDVENSDEGVPQAVIRRGLRQTEAGTTVDTQFVTQDFRNEVATDVGTIVFDNRRYELPPLGSQILVVRDNQTNKLVGIYAEGQYISLQVAERNLLSTARVRNNPSTNDEVISRTSDRVAFITSDLIANSDISAELALESSSGWRIENRIIVVEKNGYDWYLVRVAVANNETALGWVRNDVAGINNPASVEVVQGPTATPVPQVVFHRADVSNDENLTGDENAVIVDRDVLSSADVAFLSAAYESNLPELNGRTIELNEDVMFVQDRLEVNGNLVRAVVFYDRFDAVDNPRFAFVAGENGNPGAWVDRHVGRSEYEELLPTGFLEQENNNFTWNQSLAGLMRIDSAGNREVFRPLMVQSYTNERNWQSGWLRVLDETQVTVNRENQSASTNFSLEVNVNEYNDANNLDIENIRFNEFITRVQAWQAAGFGQNLIGKNIHISIIPNMENTNSLIVKRGYPYRNPQTGQTEALNAYGMTCAGNDIYLRIYTLESMRIGENDLDSQSGNFSFAIAMGLIFANANPESPLDVLGVNINDQMTLLLPNHAPGGYRQTDKLVTAT